MNYYRPVLINLSIFALVLVLYLVVVGVRNNRPYLFGTKITKAAEDSEAMKYADELRDAKYDMAVPINPTLPAGFEVQEKEIGNSFHDITLLRGPTASPERIILLQEPDPGSGTAHGWRWSSDGRAVLIYGQGTPAGHSPMNDLALVYLVNQRVLYSVASPAQP